MREIKFRGKRVDNGELIYGYFSRNDENGNCYITTQTKLGGAHSWQADPETVGQYTGLKDKNGKEIWEGDILKCVNANGWSCLGEVRFIDGCFDIVFKEPLFSGGVYRHRDYLKCWTINYAVEIISSIHDNPELLEVK